MAITRNDCILLLTEIQQEYDIHTADKIAELFKTNQPPLEIIEFINNNREFEAGKFYEKLRKSYNSKKSKLYINLVKDTEDPDTILTTLAALQTQILIYAKKLENRNLFLRHIRAEEIALVLANYYKTYDVTPCIRLTKLIKADLKCFEQMNRK